jgi:hypothetical protein
MRENVGENAMARRLCLKSRTKKRPTRISAERLERALARVQRELDDHGLWTEPVQHVAVLLVQAGHAYAEYGWLMTGDPGRIAVRALSTAMRL